MAFKIKSGQAATPDDPEALLRDLRKRKIPGLLSHQADLLRSYLEIHDATPDVALQLPTGSGKTLVGLLIAEWRRRRYGERVTYLCPTKQLVNQVAEHANLKYGLDVHAFTGKKSEYDAKASADWQAGDVVGITTYSSLFNVKPFFSDSHLIILDDAHSAENYISDCWSLQIDRSNKAQRPAFDAAASVLAPLLSVSDRGRLLGDGKNEDPRWVDMIPTPLVLGIAGELSAILDQYTDGTDMRFRWQTLKGCLEACHVYVSAWSILIRPLIPPTDTHVPFSGAKQRVYMSATLGAGGDLERITGRSPITRVPVPSGWDKQGIGRRFFVFPQRSLEDEDAESMAANAIKLYNRALYLVPDDRTADATKEWAENAIGIPVFDAKQIEESKRPFVDASAAIAVVANRYDGIDLVDDECRLLLVKGLPRGANLQERFLVSRIGANLLLDDRILTRVVQGFGRCTRSPNDYAAVIVLGEDLQRYLLTAERRRFFHPEIQAELDFGLEQSRDTSAEVMEENLRHFLEQDDEWQEADDAIIDLRKSLSQRKLPATDELAKAVTHELQYQYAMWHSDFLAALGHCRGVLGELKHADLRGYRALWLYLAGCAASLAYKSNQLATDEVSKDYFADAYRAAPGLRWLVRLHQVTAAEDVGVSDDGVEALVERLEVRFDELGTTHDRRYNEFEAEIRRAIEQSDDGKAFEHGHANLGKLLGYETGNSEDDGAPDPWWIADGSRCFVFEDFTEAKVESLLSVTKARQAASHPAWIKHKLGLDEGAEIIPILVTSSRTTTEGAVPHLKNVRYWDLSDFREWAKNAIATIRELRKQYPGEVNIGWRAEAAQKLRKAKVGPKQLVEMLATMASDVMVVR